MWSTIFDETRKISNFKFIEFTVMYMNDIHVEVPRRKELNMYNDKKIHKL